MREATTMMTGSKQWILTDRVKFCCFLKIALQCVNRDRKQQYDILKPKQAECLVNLLFFNKDTLAVLPTGYGKSLVFELVPYVKEAQARDQGLDNQRSAVIILSPLNAIIQEQIKRYGKKARQVTETINGSPSPDDVFYLIGHPEHILKKDILTLFTQQSWQKANIYIVVDEAHCVAQWGPEFRPSFKEIVHLRAIFTKAKILALTATASPKMQETIVKDLGMKNWLLVTVSIDRSNIKIIVRKRLPTSGSQYSVEESYEEIFQPLVEELEVKGRHFPKTVIYTKLKWCGHGHEMATRPHLDGTASSASQYVAQFHKACTPEMKEVTGKAMLKEDSEVRLLFATEAYSMGADSPDIRRIIHAGPPTCFETYVQEIGRAGRDGKSAEAIVHYNASDIACNVDGMTDEMREFCITSSCRREYLCNHFRSSIAFDYKSRKRHLCCDVCDKACNCSACSTMLSN